MNFSNRLKGKITQGLLESLLEDVKYHIVPLGIEEVIREVNTLDKDHYRELNLPGALRNLPDFFVALPELSKTWLVEVKYRGKWSERVRDRLGEKIQEQVKLWQPLHLVIFVGESAGGGDTPAHNLRVCKLGYQDGTIGIIKKVNEGGWGKPDKWIEKFQPWNDVTWDSMCRFQDIFDGVSGRYEDGTLTKAISVMRSLEDLED